MTPSFRAWQTSGDLLARLAQSEGLNLGGVTKAFGNDILLALSCREAGLTLVTRNTHDFTRIQRVVRSNSGLPVSTAPSYNAVS